MYHIIPLVLRISEFCRQTFIVSVGLRKNINPCHSYTEMASAHSTWYIPCQILCQFICDFSVHCSSPVSHLLKILLTQICRDRDQAECWHLGLTALISGPSSPFSSVGSKSSRQMTSCTSTPRSYIQRKSKLSAVHDTPRHKQVSSKTCTMISK